MAVNLRVVPTVFRCDGGELLPAWQFWVTNGIVTGGNYTMPTGCQPYPLPPCEHHVNGSHYRPCPHQEYPTPQCQMSCQPAYGKSYDKDKQFGNRLYKTYI